MPATAAVEGPDGALAHILLEDLMEAALEMPALAAWAQRFAQRYLRRELAQLPERAWPSGG